MQLNARQLVTQFAHMLQQELFPRLETVTGPLSPQMELLAAVVALLPLERMLSARRSSTGRPARDRAALSIAFAAKAILNLPTTRDLIDRLRVDATLRQLCGWPSAGYAVPQREAKFSGPLRNSPQPSYRSNWASLKSSRPRNSSASSDTSHGDSTAIPARETFSRDSETEQSANGEDARFKARPEERLARWFRPRQSL